MSQPIDTTIEVDVLAVVKALPGRYLLLQPDAPRFTILEVTDAYLRATLSDRSIIGKGLFEAFPDNPFLPDASGVKNLYASLLWVLEHRKQHAIDLQRYDIPDRKKGRFEYKVWKALNIPVLNKAGVIQYLIHSVEDITSQASQKDNGQQTQKDLVTTTAALKHQKQLTETILSASLNGIYALEAVRDPQGTIIDFRYLFVNDTIAHYVNLPVTGMVGSTVLELIPENKTNGFFHYFCSILEHGKPDRQQSYFDSKNFKGWFDFTAVPIGSDILVVTTQDITHLKETQLQLEQTVGELRRSNQNLEEFAHAATHDLKEPIRKIHFFTHQLKEMLTKHLNENEARLFSRIENASERMGHLVDDLLLYAHVSQRPLEKDTVDLNEKMRKVLEDLELDILESKARIHVDRLPTVKGYRRQLQQLFQNLLSNAIKYTRPGTPPQIDITASQQEKAGRLYWHIAVADNGIGFDQEHAEKIFQIFTRLHGKNEYRGTGVGLSIVKKVVENHDGFIEVESTPGEGATFHIFLPS